MQLSANPLHTALTQHAKRLQNTHMRDQFGEDAERFNKFSIESDYLFLDYSKNRIDQALMDDLFKLVEASELDAKRKAMFSGEQINCTEGRPVLHTALRADLSRDAGNEFLNACYQEIAVTKDKLYRFVEALHEGQHLGYTGKPINTVVSIGIGGSYLGPVLVCEALSPYVIEGLTCHFVANIDSTDLARVLTNIDPERTLFVIQSKSFRTQETLENSKLAKAWFLEQGASETDVSAHFVAVSSNISAAKSFGIHSDNIFPMWDWVGGRYSLWSAIGLPIVFAVGPDNFEKLLSGARSMDVHFQQQPFEQNLPIILALLGVWYNNYLGASSHAVLPYEQYLKQLPSYLQQLDMESNGKSVDLQGEPLSLGSGPVIWGDVGCNGQHAYHQLLHQGTSVIPCDFILAKQSHHPMGDHHEHLLANCLAQSQALMAGRTLDQAKEELRAAGHNEADVMRIAPHKVITGNKPSNTLIMERLTPESLGALIALYEHKVFVQGVIWGLNSFDQWGVELGKTLETAIYDVMTGQADASELDSSTQGLLSAIKS